MACYSRDFEDKILLHEFLISESTKGLSIPVSVVNPEKLVKLNVNDARFKNKVKVKVIKVKLVACLVTALL